MAVPTARAIGSGSRGPLGEDDDQDGGDRERGGDRRRASDGIPAARLIPIAAQYAPVRLGVLAGEVELGSDFDEPLPEFEPYAS